MIDHTGTATKSAFCKIVLVSTSAKGFMDPIGIITISTCPKMEVERQIHKNKMVEKKNKYKIIAHLKESKKRTGETNTQIHNYTNTQICKYPITK